MDESLLELATVLELCDILFAGETDSIFLLGIELIGLMEMDEYFLASCGSWRHISIKFGRQLVIKSERFLICSVGKKQQKPKLMKKHRHHVNIALAAHAERLPKMEHPRDLQDLKATRKKFHVILRFSKFFFEIPPQFQKLLQKFAV